MILIDYREETTTKKAKNYDLIDPIKKIGVQVEKANLEFGDAMFEGNGPDGKVFVGIERKRLHDILTCVDDSRYSAHQKVGMKDDYAISILIVEGLWRPHDGNGLLMEGFNNGNTWAYCKPGSKTVMYNKLRRYLMSVSLSGVIVTYTRDTFHTAFDITEWFHYFQKPWKLHTSMMEMQRLNIPTLKGKPNLTRRWGFDIEGVGVQHSEMAERQFRTPIALATADESEWLRIPGIGVKTAQNIVHEIMTGRKK